MNKDELQKKGLTNDYQSSLNLNSSEILEKSKERVVLGLQFQDPDYEYVLRMQKGDESAVAHLFDRHWQGMMYYIVNYVGEHDAQDVYLVSFTRAYEKIHRYEPKQKFEGWLKRIVRNASIDLLRKRKKRREGITHFDAPVAFGSKETIGDLLSNNELNGHDLLEKNEINQMIRDVVDNLSPVYRDSFILSEYKGYGNKDVANYFDVTEGTAHLRIAKARHMVFEKIHTDDYFLHRKNMKKKFRKPM